VSEIFCEKIEIRDQVKKKKISMEFGDLPPEIRFEVQHFLPPDLFWDRVSRVWAEERFEQWARSYPETVTKLRTKFGQNYAQCYNLVSNHGLSFNFWFFREFLDETTGVRKYTTNNVFKANVFVFPMPVTTYPMIIITTKPTTKYRSVDEYLEIHNDQPRTVDYTFDGVAGEFTVKPDETLVIDILREEVCDGIRGVRLQFTIGATSAKSIYRIRARDLVTALTSWPVVKFGGGVAIHQPVAPRLGMRGDLNEVGSWGES
jgi:hypothetical protein